MDTIIDDLAGELGEILNQTIVAGDIAGTAEAAIMFPTELTTQIDASFLPPSGPPPINLGDIFPDSDEVIRFPVVDDAIEVLNESPIGIGSDFRNTSQLTRQGAFAITGDLKTETIQDIRTLLAENIARGADRNRFVREVRGLLEEGTGLSDARLGTIFRHQVAGRLSDAAERSLKTPLVATSFPYRKYLATTDNRVRDEHEELEKLGLNGTAIYRSDDPVWALFRPPWDWGCRCSWTPITVEQAARLGVKEAIEWMARAKQRTEGSGQPFERFLDATAPVNPEFVAMPDFQPSPEFRRQ